MRTSAKKQNVVTPTPPSGLATILFGPSSHEVRDRIQVVDPSFGTSTYPQGRSSCHSEDDRRKTHFLTGIVWKASAILAQGASEFACRRLSRHIPNRWGCRTGSPYRSPLQCVRLSPNEDTSSSRSMIVASGNQVSLVDTKAKPHLKERYRPLNVLVCPGDGRQVARGQPRDEHAFT